MCNLKHLFFGFRTTWSCDDEWVVKLKIIKPLTHCWIVFHRFIYLCSKIVFILLMFFISANNSSWALAASFSLNSFIFEMYSSKVSKTFCLFWAKMGIHISGELLA